MSEFHYSKFPCYFTVAVFVLTPLADRYIWRFIKSLEQIQATNAQYASGRGKAGQLPRAQACTNIYLVQLPPIVEFRPLN